MKLLFLLSMVCVLAHVYFVTGNSGAVDDKRDTAKPRQKHNCERDYCWHCKRAWSLEECYSKGHYSKCKSGKKHCVVWMRKKIIGGDAVGILYFSNCSKHKKVKGQLVFSTPKTCKYDYGCRYTHCIDALAPSKNNKGYCRCNKLKENHCNNYGLCSYVPLIVPGDKWRTPWPITV